LEPFADSEISDFLFAIKPEDRCGVLKILEHVMGFRQRDILFTPQIQVMGKRNNLHVISICKQLFGLLAFDALFQGE
jgi:hypothetical protein